MKASCKYIPNPANVKISGRIPTIEQLTYRRSLCIDCGETECVFNADSVCMKPMVHGLAQTPPRRSGCLDFIAEEEIPAF